MGSMIWKWDQGVIDDLSCLFYWRPGVFLLELIGCCCPNLYLPFIHFLQPLQLDKRGNWLFFLAEKSRRHIREQSPHFYWLSIIQTKNPIFPSIFARRRFSSELPDFIREFYWGVYGQTRLWVREWYTTKLLVKHKIRHLLISDVIVIVTTVFISYFTEMKSGIIKENARSIVHISFSLERNAILINWLNIKSFLMPKIKCALRLALTHLRYDFQS